MTNEELLMGILSTTKYILQNSLDESQEIDDDYIQRRIDYIQVAIDDINDDRQIKDENVVISESHLMMKLHFKPSHEQILEFADKNKIVLTEYAKINLIETEDKSRPYWRILASFKRISKEHQLALKLTEHFMRTGQFKYE
jgi:hypothetical protein